MRLASTALIVLILATGVIAQQDASVNRAATAEDLRQQLSSRRAADVAWAAYVAGRDGMAELGPELRAWLTRAGDVDRDLESRFCVRSVLDALIRLDTRVAAAEIEPFSARFPQMTLILAARDARGTEKMLKAFYQRRLSDTAWQATCNLLIDGSPAWLADHLLSLVSLTLRIDVVDPDRRVGFGGSISSGRGCGSITRPEGFPPTALYTLTSQDAGSTLFAPGPTPISYNREERPERTFGCGSSHRSVDRGEYALDCLWILAGRDLPTRSLSMIKSVNVVWTTAAGLRNRVGQARKKIAQLRDDLIADLVSAGLVPANRPSPMPITVTVHDARNDKSVPLPTDLLAEDDEH